MSEYPERTAQFVLDRLLQLIGEQGGRELPDRCAGDELRALTLPNEATTVTTQHCGGQTRFALPYEKEDGSQGSVTACASCDLATRWPRLIPS